jgi:hypothetical protein
VIDVELIGSHITRAVRPSYSISTPDGDTTTAGNAVETGPETLSFAALANACTVTS